ncbi:rhomboid protease ROM2 [Cardiosporidium cionae]|uniref:Rhomboid protease ROM2 n=1 Tax=Cardiosporidium cionae TaxID=476202 RepID=A0ABQ7J9T4_9APIC|nr:rhomboid protease ROM2 [Cardiosporidium cionae]|eukprot:KAF8820749.1 rhomboid protease ROM2 [Cardiosporidium cionae]
MGWLSQLPKMLYPGFCFSKLIVWISLIQIVTYFAGCILSNSINPSVGVLYFLGAGYGPAVREGQIWRLITPIFLHSRSDFVHDCRSLMQLKNIFFTFSIFHLIINILLILHLGLSMESVGASTSGFGLIGTSLAEIFIAWPLLNPEAKRSSKISLLVFLLFTAMIAFFPTGALWEKGSIVVDILQNNDS